MTQVIAGMDAGGTKLAVRLETPGGERLADVEFPAQDWNASPVETAAAWLRGRLERALPADAELLAVGIGAQGCDTQEHCEELELSLAEGGIRASVVNDAALLVPAAGIAQGIGVISGTGAIGVGSSAAGDTLFAGGWGWVIGDEAGAPGIVRLATIAALTADDEGEPDDGLLSALLEAFGVTSPQSLARAVNDEATAENWGPRAPAVFAAAEGGSALANTVIGAAADHLATLVTRLIDRGAVGSTVVAAGSVIVNQPRLEVAFRERILARHPQLGLELLTDSPVAGGVVLAKRLIDTRAA